MPANSDGPDPWGSAGSGSVPPTGGGSGGGRGSRPGGPWGGGGWGGGPAGGPGGGPGRGPGRPGGPLPDIDELIARAQGFIRGLTGSGGGGRGGGGLRGLPSGGRAIVLLGIAVIALWLASGFYRVEPDQVGVVLRFGAFTRTTLPGLNYHLPWPIETVETPAVTRINRTEIGFRTTAQGTREMPEESLMLTGDENIIDINLVVLWRIDNAVDYLFNTRSPDTTVKAVAESVLREVMGRTPIQPALGPLRAQIAADVMHQSQQILNSYHAGVEITQVLPQKVDPPAEVVESFRDVQRANTDAERMRNEADTYRNNIVPRARGDAAQIIATAEGEKQATIARAKGEAQRFLSVLAAYRAAKQVTLQRLYIDTMGDIMRHTPTTVLDTNVKGLLPFLPLGGAGTSPMPPSSRSASPTPASVTPASDGSAAATVGTGSSGQ